MLKRLVTGSTILLLSLVFTGAVYAQAYRWVDENGVVHYSDRPHAGAEQVQLPTSRSSSRPTTRPAQSAARPSRGGDDAAAAQPEQPFSYESLDIAAPAAEETLWNIEGVLNVTLDLRPALQPGHRVRVYFDGAPQEVTGTSFEIQEVYRGVHNLQVEVLDETGKLMIRSLPNRFYVQQNSIVGN